MSDLVGNPENRFSQNEAHIMLASVNVNDNALHKLSICGII